MKQKGERCMLKYFLPNQHAKSIFEITPESLLQKGVKGIITDLDNTLVEWDRPLATPELVRWFEQMKASGIQVTIVSNNNEKRVKAFADPLKIPFIFEARKPLTRAFQQAIRDMKLKKEEVVVIGDQLLTDIFGGNLLGLHTILVVPVSETDGWVTRINRKIERRILDVMRKKGMIHWEG
jgi:HAD superfamily phosphatase (TIGR01668 family)